MKNWTRIVSLLAVGWMTALPVQADRGGDSIQDRLSHQSRAIQRGIDAGSLTRHEADGLRREQADIRQLADRLRRDGSSPRESFRMLDRRLDRSSRHIQDLMYNDAFRHGRDDHRPPPRRPEHGRVEHREPPRMSGRDDRAPSRQPQNGHREPPRQPGNGHRSPSQPSENGSRDPARQPGSERPERPRQPDQSNDDGRQPPRPPQR